MTAGQVRVTVVGAGDIGRGWAALCAAHGWPVRLFDNESRALTEAIQEASERAHGLLVLSQAKAEEVERGIQQLSPGRSLLHACEGADWIIECIREDLIAKQKLFEALESAAPKARAVTSSSSTLVPADISARCRRPDRCFVAHPLNPPELIPLVEILAGRETDGALLELAKGWLRALGRIPVTLKKPVRGNIANRIAAAVWREAIQLVLDGAIDVDDLDRAVSLGPGLGWAAAGPHLTYHLAAGNRGVSGFLQHLLAGFEDLWKDLASWDKLDSEQQHRLIVSVEKAYEGQIDVIRRARDRRLAVILQALERAKERPG